MFNVRSCYCIARSTIRIPDLIEHAKKTGRAYAAICDDNFYAVPRLFRLANSAGVKPVFGLVVETDENDSFSFFPLNRSGYLELVEYKNGLLKREDLLNSRHLIKVFEGPIEAFEQYREKHSDVLPGVYEDYKKDERTTGDEVFFQPVNILKHDHAYALEMIENIGRIPAEDREAPYAYHDNAALIEQNPDLSAPLEKLSDLAKRIDEYDLRTDYKIPLPPQSNITQEEDYIHQYALEKIEKLEEDKRETYRDRLEKEYRVISKKGFTRYLLLAKDIVETAREIGASVGPGRGSAVSSLLVHLLGITEPDPLEMDLIFERFLSMDRSDEPDIDIDVQDTLRPELLKRLRERYGQHRLVNVITFGTYGEKLIRREVKKHLRKEPGPEDDKKSDERIRELLPIIEGLPHHVSTHAAGLIFSSADLRSMIPLQELDTSQYMTQYEMEGLNECGVFKMDILGLTTLSILNNMAVDFNSAKIEDRDVYKSIKPENLSGIFQLDSRSGRNLTARFTPENFNELRILISLNRPGPGQSGLTDEWIKRRNGKKQVTYVHPLVKEIFSETHGVPIFQEQIMEMSMKLGNFSPKKANSLRKAMGKKDGETMQKLREDFIKGCMENDLDLASASSLFDRVSEFAGYAFNKAHATAYGLITFRSSYAKLRKPLHFFKAMFNGNLGKYKKLFSFVREAGQKGIRVLGPDINKSHIDTTIEGENLRIGFRFIKEMGPGNAAKIVEEREKGAFKSLENFFTRVPEKFLNDRILKRMFWAGCFESLEKGLTPDDLLTLRDRGLNNLKKIGSRLFGDSMTEEDLIEKKRGKPGRQIQEQIREEYTSFGFLLHYQQFFKLSHAPFYEDDLHLGLCTGRASGRGEYEIFLGHEFVKIRHNKTLAEGDIVLIHNKWNRKRCCGFFYPDESRLSIFQKDLSELLPDIKSNLATIKSAGIKVISTEIAKYRMEVRV